jgi:four helix bundle protein
MLLLQGGTMKLKSFKELDAWKESMALVEEVYKATESFPKSQLYSLTQQVQKAVVSIPSNIAEGNGRKSNCEYTYHVRVARGSLCEVETQLLVAQRLRYIDSDQMANFNERVQSVGRLLNGLLSYLQSDRAPC